MHHTSSSVNLEKYLGVSSNRSLPKLFARRLRLKARGLLVAAAIDKRIYLKTVNLAQLFKTA
jgi:hypothetical protein